MIVGGVGLGHCHACNAPGAFWYPCNAPDLAWLGPGVWMCDGCQHPAAAHARIQADIARIRRNAIGVPTATRHGYQCATPDCELDAGHPDHHESQTGRSWRTYPALVVAACRRGCGRPVIARGEHCGTRECEAWNLFHAIP